jgi:tRNA U34 5-methylaminomethyl-2-thiouridine-forming methyltransferase MnmC
MQRIPVITKDGSHTISIPEMGVTYHSTHGAIQESLHVFIEAGLNYFIEVQKPDKISIMEMGFGTGLNALLSLIETEKLNCKINYHSLELYPLREEEFVQLNYCDQLGRSDLGETFQRIHQCNWNEAADVTDKFSLIKIDSSLQAYSKNILFNIIYFDAFDPAAQPELWTKEIFDKLYSLLIPGGVIVTYCCKGDVRRALMASGFTVNRIPGPPGKRQMLRGIKELNGT